MKGLSFAGDRTVQFIDVPDPTPGPGEVVLEIKSSGMCGSDLKFYRLPKGGASSLGVSGTQAPVIAGHEPCGVVAAVGANVNPRAARVGMRVMVHHYVGCGVCPHCRTGWSQLCPEGVVVYGVNGHGGHAPYMKVPASTLVPLPDGLSFVTGAAIACGTGTAYYALRRLNLSGNDTIAIFGQGPVGLSATQLAKAMGSRVIALDVSPERLLRAGELGADHTINPAKESAIEAIKALSGGKGVDFALDTTGVPSARAESVRSTKVWGTVCLVGEGDTMTLNVSPDLLRKQMTIIASWTFSTVGLAECADFVLSRNVDVEALFTNRWKLEEGEQAYRWFDAQNAGKGVFVF
jgi:threonine dehydrogenase-like Zn-dependent dehydrogenase